ncbi:MAG TPA: glycerol-3-phosphate 1-O-acyltransferase PlsY [Burkholderiaceae bacterium]|nr:glycerol-3-phosphate 1-O-acyltransferase PlsY [Burkholderiaceae bacterium]
METLYSLVAIALAYLIGSISFAVVVSRALGLADPRSYGSRNPGATNVLRTGNRAAAALTLAGDGAKGAVAVLLAAWAARRFGLPDATAPLAGLAAFVGHLFPVYHRFAGGKGVATAAGVLLALNVWHGLATMLTWAIIAFFFRYSSLAALVAAVFSPLYFVFLFGFEFAALVVLAMSLLLIYRHRANIENLIAGKERRIGEKRGAAAEPRPPERDRKGSGAERKGSGASR